jgi:hypothetical protein
MTIKQYKEMSENTDNLINSGDFLNKKILIFGHSYAAEKLIDYLCENNITVKFLLDNSKYKQGSKYKNILIENPDILRNFNSKNSIILIASRFYQSMQRQILNLGYDGKIVKILDYNSFEEFSISEDVFDKKTARAARGINTLNKLKHKNENAKIIVCPFGALGDVYNVCAFLSAFCKLQSVSKYVITVVGKSCEDVAKIFGVKDIHRVNQQEMDELVQAIIFTDDENCFIAHHDRPYTNNLTDVLLKRRMNFQDLYRYGVFGLDKNAICDVPMHNEKFINNGEIQSGKTVIVSPYAKSVGSVPMSFWENIVEDKIKQGFRVLTNVCGDELPIKGSLPLRVSIKQIISAAEQAGYFIGIRSGLCDILSSANCDKTVIFPDCFYSYTNIKTEEFFELPNWNKIVYNAL